MGFIAFCIRLPLGWLFLGTRTKYRTLLQSRRLGFTFSSLSLSHSFSISPSLSLAIYVLSGVSAESMRLEAAFYEPPVTLSAGISQLAAMNAWAGNLTRGNWNKLIYMYIYVCLYGYKHWQMNVLQVGRISVGIQNSSVEFMRDKDQCVHTYGNGCDSLTMLCGNVGHCFPYRSAV